MSDKLRCCFVCCARYHSSITTPCGICNRQSGNGKVVYSVWRRPGSHHRYNHVSLNSQSNISHHIWITLSILVIMLKAQHSHEQMHLNRGKEYFSCQYPQQISRIKMQADEMRERSVHPQQTWLTSAGVSFVTQYLTEYEAVKKLKATNIKKTFMPTLCSPSWMDQCAHNYPVTMQLLFIWKVVCTFTTIAVWVKVFRNTTPVKQVNMHNFRLLLQCKWYLGSSGMLRSEDW
jgi:hypothetical protein